MNVKAYYDANGNLQYVAGDSKRDLGGANRLSAQWDASGNAAPVSWKQSQDGGGLLGGIMSDPILAALANAGAAYFGGPLGSAALAAAQGKSLEDIAKSAALSYGAGQIAGGVNGVTDSPALSQFAGSTGAGLLSGKDLNTSLTNAALGTAAGNATDYLANAMSDQQLGDWSQQNAEAAYNNAPSPTEQDVLAADNTIPLPEQTPQDPNVSGPGYYNELTGEFVPDPNGGLTGPLTDTSGTNTGSMDGYTYNPDTQTWGMPDGTSVSFDGSTEGQPALSNTQEPYTPPPVDETPPESFDPSPDVIKTAAKTAAALATKPSGSAAAATPSGAAATGSEPTFLPGTKLSYNPVGKDSTPMLNPVLANLAGFGTQAPSQYSNSADLMLGTSQSLQPKSDVPESYAQGGLTAVHPMGEPEFYSEGGLGNMYIQGRGDGTSDDIPAMVANNEFVIPADIVSALGNGSSEAGGSVLDQFVRNIRKHKHSNPPDELPPQSKGPLAYLSPKGRK